MLIDVVTLFPEIVEQILSLGVTGRARTQGIWDLRCWNPRAYTNDVHHKVDDRPYGGGPGMVMMAEPLAKAIADIRATDSISCDDTNADCIAPVRRPVILMSPVGKPFTQFIADDLSKTDGFILVCGRYEGVDQRFIDKYVDFEISLGDFVLSGGELPAMSVIDAVTRLLPGVLNTEDSFLRDSFQPAIGGLLDHPHYTRPEVFEGLSVPDVLLSGNHKHIKEWRREQSIKITKLKRSDILTEDI